MLSIDLRGKRALVAGVADDGGFGFAIAKALRRGRRDGVRGYLAARARHLQDHARARQVRRVDGARGGGKMTFEKIYPLDAEFDDAREVPAEVRQQQALPRPRRLHHRRPGPRAGDRLRHAALDIVVHSLANGPEVKNPLMDTSRKGYLAAVSGPRRTRWCRWCAPRAHGAPGRQRSCRSRTWPPSAWCRATAAACPSAKAALESDTRVLAYEAGRKWGHRVNVISAGPFASRAASAIGFIDRMVASTPSQLAAARGADRGRGRPHRGVPVQPARQRHHRRDDATSTRATTPWRSRRTSRASSKPWPSRSGGRRTTLRGVPRPWFAGGGPGRGLPPHPRGEWNEGASR
jgi:enoyl-[acyl-carrier protein] reductase I